MSDLDRCATCMRPTRSCVCAPVEDAPRCPFCGEAITGQPLEHLVDCGPSLEWLGDPPVSPTDSGPEKVEAWLRERYVRAPSHTACVKHVRSLLAEVARLQERVSKLEAVVGANEMDARLIYDEAAKPGAMDAREIRSIALGIQHAARSALSTTEGDT